MRHRFCLNFWFGVPKYKKEHERVRGWKRRRRRARERSSKTGQQEKASQANGARNFGAPRPMRSPFALFLCAALAENPTTDAPRRVTKLQGEKWGNEGAEFADYEANVFRERVGARTKKKELFCCCCKRRSCGFFAAFKLSLINFLNLSSPTLAARPAFFLSLSPMNSEQKKLSLSLWRWPLRSASSTPTRHRSPSPRPAPRACPFPRPSPETRQRWRPPSSPSAACGRRRPRCGR